MVVDGDGHIGGRRTRGATCRVHVHSTYIPKRTMSQPSQPVHLNIAACVIKHSEEKGRGVYGQFIITHLSRFGRITGL
jgi:hypothetical protein